MQAVKHPVSDPFPGNPSMEVAPPQAIHRCLEHIWKRLHMRARFFLREGEFLVLRDCVGAYLCCPEIGLRVHPGSVVWEIFLKGDPVNLTEADGSKERPHTLPEPVTIKAVIPLKVENLHNGQERILGVLVVDSGHSPEPVEDRDFQYLQVLGMLMSEILQRSILLNRIQEIQKDKERMAQEAAHIFRNRFAVIGGYARKLGKVLLDSDLRQWAGIILKEVEKGECALELWMDSHEEGEGFR
jgi:hypothetical protein